MRAAFTTMELRNGDPMPRNRQRQNGKRQIRAVRRSYAAATPQPTRRSAPLPNPPTRPTVEPNPFETARPTADHVRDTATQMDASLHPQHSRNAPGGSTEGTAGETRQVPIANQLIATPAVWWQGRLAQSYAAYSATAVAGMLQLGQLWAAFLQASMRQSSAAAFSWTVRR